MAEELFKQGAGKQVPEKTEASGNPATPGAQNQQPKGPATSTNQTSSGPTNVTPPAEKKEGEGDPSQTTQDPNDGKSPDVGSTGAPAGNQPPADTENKPDDADPETENASIQQPSELDMLKKRAKMMGITFSNNIGLDALREKIKDAMENSESAAQRRQQEQQASKDPSNNAVTQPDVSKGEGGNVNALTGGRTGKKLSLRQHLQQEKMKLVRVRITNLDPKKKDLPGEIITVANEFLGTVRKFVPFGEVTDNGYHIPQCLYDMLKERTFVSIKTRKGPKGEQIVEHQNAREFSLEVLPPLTQEELAKLGAAQQAAGGL